MGGYLKLGLKNQTDNITFAVFQVLNYTFLLERFSKVKHTAVDKYDLLKQV